MKHTKPEAARMRLKSLRPHPLQQLFDTTTTPAEDAALAQDLRKFGQRDPIHVLPPNVEAGRPHFTVLDGVRRCGAQQANGKTEVDVLIRYDLVDADAATVEQEFLRFNSARRQLHPIDRARIALRQFVLEKNRPSGRLYRSDEPKARERIGRLIGMSGRNLHRYYRLLLTPIEVQRAVRDGKLPLVRGEKVEGLSKAKQAEIAERIANGEPPKSVVGEYIGVSDGKHRKAADALASFVRGLERGVHDLDGRAERLRGRKLLEYRPVLNKAKQVIDVLITRCDLEQTTARKDAGHDAQ